MSTNYIPAFHKAFWKGNEGKKRLIDTEQVSISSIRKNQTRLYENKEAIFEVIKRIEKKLDLLLK